MKVVGSQLSTSTTLGGQTPGAPLIVQGHPIGVLLFGKRKPKLVDKKKHPKLGKALRKLESLKDQIAELAGQAGGELSLELCEGENASISRDGQIAFGLELLEKHQSDDDLLVAVMGHEIGHQPWTWPNRDLSHLTKAQLDHLYREEEAKADRFAGRVLAELGADPRSVCDFLLAAEGFEAHPPTDYYPAKVRSQIIRDAFRRRGRILEAGRSLLGPAGPRLRELR